jgi:hypothetical protein
VILIVSLKRVHSPMLCDRCKEREATCEFAYGNQPRHARTWHLCDTCFQQFAPGFPTASQIRRKMGPVEPDQTSCGWVSFTPDEIRPKDDENEHPKG